MSLIELLKNLNLESYMDFSAQSRSDFQSYVKQRSSELAVDLLSKPRCNGKDGPIIHSLYRLYSYFESLGDVTYANTLVLDGKIEFAEARIASSLSAEPIHKRMGTVIEADLASCHNRCTSLIECTIYKRTQQKLAEIKS